MNAATSTALLSLDSHVTLSKPIHLSSRPGTSDQYNRRVLSFAQSTSIYRYTGALMIFSPAIVRVKCLPNAGRLGKKNWHLHSPEDTRSRSIPAMNAASSGALVPGGHLPSIVGTLRLPR